MAELVCSWSHQVDAIPSSYVIPLQERPLDPVPIIKEIPVIDLGQAKGKDRAVVVQQLSKAFEEYGFFQVINHGVSENLMDEAMKVYQEFFNSPVEEKENYLKAMANSEKSSARLYTSKSEHFGAEEHLYWRDSLEHDVGADDRKTWPDYPPRLREIIGPYSAEVRKLGNIILALISEGLGMEAEYIDKELRWRMIANHYPACPDPSSTLGAGGHCDATLLTIIQQQVYGLQILKDEKWVGVEPLPHAFVVNSGLALTVISNGKLTSVAHRVVTNTSQARTSIGTFLFPGGIVEPAKSLLGPFNPPLFKPFHFFKEFLPHYTSKKDSLYLESLEHFKINV